MLTAYKDITLQMTGHEILERIDCHYLGGGSDKVYIGTIQHYKDAGNNLPYVAVCYYGRRSSYGGGLNTNVIGHYATFGEAAKAADTQMKSKVKKGYKLIGRERLEGAGGLRPAVLKFIREQFPAGCIVESETGNRAEVIEINEEGAITVVTQTDGKTVKIPFGKYRFHIVQTAKA